MLNTRFNLSILECKWRARVSNRDGDYRFNLSILECKSCTKRWICQFRGFVLIYPYWNVNRIFCPRYCPCICVLIYPYWNVNNTVPIYQRIDGAVLIYPYWNVNLSLRLLAALPARFNLSILECKWSNSTLRRSCQRVLIYPYWNVKEIRVRYRGSTAEF